jgi:putative ABC transport system ATP-binding protein
MIKLQHINKSYEVAKNSISILKNINFQIFSGEFIAIMGPSGSGKSTLMNILGLLDHASTGKYYFEKKDVTTLNHEELAKLRNRTVGFIFQSFMLMPRMDAIENISLPLIYQNTPARLMKQKSERMLAKVGLQGFERRKPTELSGGQQQRVAIARALVTSPKIILADEPTGSLDSETGQEIFRLLNELNQTEQTTIVIVTHDKTIASQCRRVITLRNGEIEMP